MKKLATIAITLACVAVLGTALQGFASDEQPSSGDPASSKASEVSTKPCCQAKSAEASSDPVAAGKTGCCDSRQGYCDSGQANDGVLAKKESCSGAACQASKTKEPAAAKCGFCKDEACEEECSSCAEAKHASAVSDDRFHVAHGPGKGMGRGRAMGPGKGMGRGRAMGPGKGMGHGRAMGPGKGMGHGRAMGHGHAGDSQHDKDHEDFFFLIEHRESIRRTVKELPNGIEALTESDVPEVAEMIQVHVEAMYDRVENTKPIRMRDPIFREIFANADKIKMEIEHTEHGVRVTETSTDPYVVKLLQEHAKVVSLWIENGYAELPKNHPAPKR